MTGEPHHAPILDGKLYPATGTRRHALLVESGVRCAWLSLDQDDNDTARFMRHLIAALQRADARIGKDIAAQLTADFASGSKPMLEMMASDLAQVQQRIVLFLDDLQFIQEPKVLEIVDWLINY